MSICHQDLLFPKKEVFCHGWEVIGTLTENKYLGLWVQSPAAHASNFSTPDCKKINKTPSVKVIVICSDHRHPWRDSSKGLERALTLAESITAQDYYYFKKISLGDKVCDYILGYGCTVFVIAYKHYICAPMNSLHKFPFFFFGWYS